MGETIDVPQIADDQGQTRPPLNINVRPLFLPTSCPNLGARLA